MNTLVLIFHAQNLLHILKKKEKARIKLMNFSQKYMGSVLVIFVGGVTLYVNIQIEAHFLVMNNREKRE